MWYDASVAAGSGVRKDHKMARTARIKKSNNGTARYHLMSRTNDRRFLFEKGRVKTQLVDALKRAAAFSGVELEAYVAMDNHFHIVCKVVRGGDALPEGELLRRVAALKGERAAGPARSSSAARARSGSTRTSPPSRAPYTSRRALRSVSAPIASGIRCMALPAA